MLKSTEEALSRDGRQRDDDDDDDDGQFSPRKGAVSLSLQSGVLLGFKVVDTERVVSGDDKDSGEDISFTGRGYPLVCVDWASRVYVQLALVMSDITNATSGQGRSSLA